MSQAESGVQTAPPAPEVKPGQDWKAEEVARELQGAAAKKVELREGLLGHLPAVHMGKSSGPIGYERITALIYRPHPHADGFTLSVELKDRRSARSVTVASAKDVIVEGTAARESKAGLETGQRIKELKAAMRSAYTVDYKGIEYRRISAILIRSYLPGEISLEVELVAPSGDGIVIAPESEIQMLGHQLNRT